jgi:hypothetical protein
VCALLIRASYDPSTAHVKSGGKINRRLIHHFQTNQLHRMLAFARPALLRTLVRQPANYKSRTFVTLKDHKVRVARLRFIPSSQLPSSTPRTQRRAGRVATARSSLRMVQVSTSVSRRQKLWVEQETAKIPSSSLRWVTLVRCPPGAGR